MVDIVVLLRTLDYEDLMPEEISAAADEIERLRADNARLNNALAVYRALMCSVTKDVTKAIGDEPY